MKLILNKRRHFNNSGSKTEKVLRKNSKDKNNWFLEETGEVYNRFEELQDRAEANTLPMLIDAAVNGQRVIKTLNKEGENPIDLEDMPVTSGQRQAKADAMIAEIQKQEEEYKKAVKKYEEALRAASEDKKQASYSTDHPNKTKTDYDFFLQEKGEQKNGN